MFKRGLLCALALLLVCAPCLAEEEPAIQTGVTLSDAGITIDGDGAAAEGSVLTISLPGVYTIGGTLSDGQIIVDCPYEENVRLVLNGVSVHCEKSAAIYIVASAKRTVIETAKGTTNTFTDGADRVLNEDEEPNGVIFSKGDLTLTGEGTLVVTSLYEDGIVSKDDLRIKGGTINVTAPDDGVRGKDAVEIYDGQLVVYAGGDGVKSNNAKDAERGYIAISGGSLNITCCKDPLDAEHAVTIADAKLEFHKLEEYR